jgi:hypothetical protein
MNRSVLIVIVDFLLISLLAFSRLDEPDARIQDPGQRATLGSPSPASNRQDLVDVLKVSLSKERESREQMDEQLRRLQAQLQSREQTLGDRDKLIREAEQMLRAKAQEADRLAEQRADIEQQYKSAQSNVAELQNRLTNTLTEASLSRQHLEAVRNDLQTREQEQAILKRKMEELEKTRQAAEVEKQRLSTQLQVAEAEKRLVREQLDSAQTEVTVERQEKARLEAHTEKLQEHVDKLQEHADKLQEHATKLAEGVTVLAEKSGELTHEIRDNRPLAPNTVFNEFLTNRVRGDFRAVRTGIFGREVNREKEAKSVLVRQGNQVYALYHVNDTPLNFSFPGVDWDWLIGNLRRGAAVARVERMSFLAVDPRAVVIPISEAKARELGSKIYTIPKDPFKFENAILVGANEGYYGECKFQMDPANPQYVRMQRERFSWLVGKFTPSSGDLVFTKQGELLGLMVNKEYCLLLTDFAPAYHIQMGIGIGDQQTGVLLSQLYAQVARMPAKLQ